MKTRAWWLVGAALVGVTGGSIGAMAAAGGSTFAYGTYTVVAGSTLTRVPYTSDLTTNSVEVNWATNNSSQTPGYVAWGPTGNCAANSKRVTSSLPSFPSASGGTSATSWAFTAGTTHELQSSVELTGLSAGTSYCYEALTSAKVNLMGSGVSQSFSTLDTTLPASGLTFDVIGDTGETAGVDESTTKVNQDQAALDTEIGQSVKASGAKFLVTAGDMAYQSGSNTAYGDLQQTGSEISDIFGPSYWPNTGGIPTYSVAGNHGESITPLRTWPEEVTAASDSPNPGTYAYDAYNDPTNDIKANSPDEWYAVQDGNVRLYALDGAWADSQSGETGTGNATGALCTHDPTKCTGYQADDSEHWQQQSAELTWLKADLAAHPGGIKLAFFHYPLQSLNDTQPSDLYAQRDLEPVLAANGVSIAFNGHAHTYQRFSVATSTSTQITNYVTGGGGGTLEPVETTGDTKYTICKNLMSIESVYAIGWSPTSSAGTACGQTAVKPTQASQVYNYLQVHVVGNQITVTPYNALNQAFDVQSYTVNANGTTTLNGSGTTPPTTTTTTTTTVPSTTTTTTTAPSTTTTTAPAGSTAEVQAVAAAGKTVSLAPTGSGDTLVLSASLYTGTTNHITAVTDSNGDTWKAIAAAAASGHNSEGEMWYLPNVPAGVTSVTVTTNTANLAIGVQEFSGLGANPTVTSSLAASTATATSFSATASGSGVAVGFLAGHANAEVITASGVGFTSQAQVNSATPFATLVTGYRLGASGSQTYSGSAATAMYWAAGVVILTP
jgi:hypothetical protein